MGLAAYGKLHDAAYRLLQELVYVEGLSLRACSMPRRVQIFEAMEKFARKEGEAPMAAADLAYTGQKVFSEAFFQYLNNLYALGISQNLILGGGCALNSSAAGQITERTEFRRSYTFCAPGDDGNAVGAALLAFYEDKTHRRPAAGFQSPYLGSELSPETLSQVENFSRIPTLKRLRPEEAPRSAAELLASGKIVGWVQGRAEFGPRALGNRSILADPRRRDIKDEINERIKFREAYRPFAPSILDQHGDEFFENYQPTPYMERTLRFREAVKRLVPGVVHQDGSGRLQTVRREWNPRFYELVSHFHHLTGIPMVLNTSFNIMGRPISHSVEDTLAMFYSSGLDCLFVGDLFIGK